MREVMGMMGGRDDEGRMMRMMDDRMTGEDDLGIMVGTMGLWGMG